MRGVVVVQSYDETVHFDAEDSALLNYVAQHILTALARMGQMAPIFVYIAFVFPYGIQVVHVSRDFLLVVLLIGAVVTRAPRSSHISRTT